MSLSEIIHWTLTILNSCGIFFALMWLGKSELEHDYRAEKYGRNLFITNQPPSSAFVPQAPTSSSNDGPPPPFSKK